MTMLEEGREELLPSVARVERTLERFRSDIRTFRRLMVCGMVILGLEMVVLFLTIILRWPS